MKDLNYERKEKLCWKRVLDAHDSKNYNILRSAYWSLYHLRKNYIDVNEIANVSDETVIDLDEVTNP